jgi:hypothetical protein
MPIETSTHTYIHQHTHAHPHTETNRNKQIRTRELYESKPLAPEAPRNATRPTNPPPRKPFAYQLAVPTPTRTALINQLAYSDECYPLLTEVPPLSFLFRTPALTYVSPSHPCAAESIHALSHPFTN